MSNEEVIRQETWCLGVLLPVYQIVTPRSADLNVLSSQAEIAPLGEQTLGFFFGGKGIRFRATTPCASHYGSISGLNS